MDTLGKDEKSTIPLSVYSCQNGVSANQYLSLSKKDQLRREDVCAVTMDSTSVVLASCNFADQKQTWTHEKVKYIQQYFQINFVLSLQNGSIIHFPSKLCLDVEGLSNNDQIKLKTCEANKPSQQWRFQYYAT